MPFIPLIVAGAGATAIGLSAASTAVGVGTAVVGAMSSIQQGQAQAGAARFNAQVESNNAQMSAWNRQMQHEQFAREALMTEQQGAVQASRLEMRNGALEATNINNAATSGLAISGSTQDVIYGAALNGEMDVLDAQYKTHLESWQKEVQGATASYNGLIEQHHHQDQAALFSSEADNAEQSGFFGAVGSIVGQGSRMLTSGDFFQG